MGTKLFILLLSLRKTEKILSRYGRINLDFHKFECNGTEYTQRQLIDMMIERLEFSFRKEYNDFDEDKYMYVSKIEKIWAIVLPAMWW